MRKRHTERERERKREREQEGERESEREIEKRGIPVRRIWASIGSHIDLYTKCTDAMLCPPLSPPFLPLSLPSLSSLYPFYSKGEERKVERGGGKRGVHFIKCKFQLQWCNYNVNI